LNDRAGLDAPRGINPPLSIGAVSCGNSMIVSCPTCSSRNHLSPREANGLAEVMCRACGHRWTEVEIVETIDVIEKPSRNLPRAIERPIERNLARIIDHDDAPEFEARRLADLAREAQAQFAVERAAARRRWQSWAIFTAFFFSPIAAAALMPETIVAAAPISYRAYEALGLDVNVYGLEIRRIESQHALIEGTRILTVKGEISNVDSDMRKIPWLRFALLDSGGKELYSWNLDTGARPLRAGETTGFMTRVQAPPELAHNLKIRFAKADELGSDAAKALPPLPATSETHKSNDTP
jgi:Zn ribbon nucleic-acid-binding protein